jgi:hypothetical protein
MEDFIAAHIAVLAGAAFFTVAVLTWRGLITYGAVLPACGNPACKPGRYPTEKWMSQIGRNTIDETSEYLRQYRYVPSRPRHEVL